MARVGVARGAVPGEPGEADTSMRVTRSTLNGHGSRHGGHVFTLADTAFPCACNSHGYVTVAAKADIVFVTPVEGGRRARRRGAGSGALRPARDLRRHGVPGREDGAREVVAEFRGHSHTPRTPLG
ncbi:MAG: hotdog fold thioesterase [Acidothermales bacterium]|nr:hotdog fold thioesterase [Acidothermales bacterium]